MVRAQLLRLDYARCRGVTLVELVMTLAIGAILMAIAVPSFQGMMETNRAAGVTNELVRALALTRSEAVTRGVRVTICKTSNPNAATPACDSSSNWTDGWIIFADINSDGDIDADDQVIRVGQISMTDVDIEPRGFSNRLTYTPSGTTAARSFQLIIGSERRALKINNTGRVRTCNPDQDSDCEWLS